MPPLPFIWFIIQNAIDMTGNMELRVLTERLSICRLGSTDGLDLGKDLYFIGKTKDEVSLVCPEEDVPSSATERVDGWRALMIVGPLDLSLIGILSRITTILADNGIGIFAVSTFDTDYILVREENLERAKDSLRAKGYVIR